jgi:hypothetical protein
MFFPDDNSAPSLVPEAALENRSARDLNVDSSSMRVFFRTRDGSIREADRAANFPKTLSLPAGDSAAFKFPLLLNTAIDDGCYKPENTDIKSPEFQKFLERCVGKIVGVTMLIDAPQFMRVNLSFPDTPDYQKMQAQQASGPPQSVSAGFDPSTATAVPETSARLDCANTEVVRYDRNGRAVCLGPATGVPWEDDPMVGRGQNCRGDGVKVYDDQRNEYCVSLTRIAHLGRNRSPAAPADSSPASRSR